VYPALPGWATRPAIWRAPPALSHDSKIEAYKLRVALLSGELQPRFSILENACFLLRIQDKIGNIAVIVTAK
jgi:hypothetical protein